MTRPGTINHALSLPDGSGVYLDAVVVDKIRARQTPSYFVIRECFDSKARLVVYAPPSPLLRFGQTVDVYGTIDTLPNGSRAVINASVFGYTDSEGNLLYHGPLIKGLLAPTAWEWKSALTVYSVQGTVRALDLPTPPGEPNPAPGDPPVYCATIAVAKALADGTAVELQCKPIDSVSSGYFIMAEDDTSDTLRVYYTEAVDEMDRVNKVTGTMATEASERVLNVDSGPGFDPQGFVGKVQTVAQGTIAWLKTLPDYWFLPADLNGKVVSRVLTGQDCFYIQEPDRSSGIQVYDPYFAPLVQPGDVVSIAEWDAETATIDGERVLCSYWMQIGDPVDPPTPLGLTNSALGGGSFNVLTPGPQGACGINNVGLLARTWGTVTATGPDYFYIDDGSQCDDGSGPTGVRVVGVSGYMPAVDDYVAVTGLSGLATYHSDPARTLRLAGSSDLTAIRPILPPTDLRAVSTGSGKIALYWNQASGALGYNVYRGTSSGAEDYENPVNGGTLVNTPSYPGSSVYTYTDTGLTDGTRYYYTVKAVDDWGETHPSNEDDDAPTPDAIPWDSSTPGAVLSAFRSVFPDTEGQLRVVGPDARVYQDGESDILPPDGYVIPGTNQFVCRHDGIAISLFDDPVASGTQLLYTTLPAADGPYRRVKTKLASGYAGAQGRITLPKYKGTGCFINQRDGDFAYIMLGNSEGRKNKWEVDAGLISQYLPNQELPEGEGGGRTWAPYIKSRASDPAKPLLNLPPGQWGRFNPDQDLEIRYHTRATLPGRTEKVCAMKIYSESQGLTRTLGSYVGCEDGEKVRIKRTHSIAHRAPQGWKGVKKTGSYCERVYWNSGQLKTSSGSWTNWSSSTSDEDGKFTGGIATITWYPTSPYVREDDIRITIPSE